MTSRIAIIGTVGVPGQYGGFETLADNLVRYHQEANNDSEMHVYCSGKSYPKPRLTEYCQAKLHYIPLRANGIVSIAYDFISMMHAITRGSNRILLLGVSGALGIPLIRLLSRARIITNIDGIEWRRQKWSRTSRLFLRLSELIAVRFSHHVIADNQVIADYVKSSYGSNASVIAYGGDHSLAVPADPSAFRDLPHRFALGLCRIEPENNVHAILDGWSQLDLPLVFVGNWEGSAYGRDLKNRYTKTRSIHILDPVYEPNLLRALRDRAVLYVHGHSAGGTNPSLVEMMHFKIPVLAWDCAFNRSTTQGKAWYFSDASELAESVRKLDPRSAMQIGEEMGRIATTRYTWSRIGRQYFDILA